METRRNRFLWIFLFLFLPAAAGLAWAEGQRKIVPQAKTPAPNLSVETGRYYAIVIGINEYRHLPKLQTAKKDAEDVARVLREKFGFETRLLLDATRHEIVDSINQARARLREDDNFLLYYAGHGEFDKTTEKAFWLPADARPDSDAEWIIADTVTSNIKRFAARHVLVVADSCYSGTMTRKAVTSLASSEERAVHLRKMLRKNSRTLMASGGNEPVADSGGEGHSIFASVLLRALERAEEPVFTAESLFDEEIKVAVSGRAEQTPEYHDIRNSGHDGGDFVFVAKTAPQGPAGDGGNSLKEERQKLEAERARIEEERKKLEAEKQKLARLQDESPPPVPGKEKKKEEEKTASLPPPAPKAKPAFPAPSLEDMTAKIQAAREKKKPEPVSPQARELDEKGKKYALRGTMRDYREALKWYRQAADLGHAPAMKKIGDSYAFSFGGLKIDAREAMKWYRQAADKGDADGYAAIGALYLSGVGDMPLDPAEAMKWYQKAASAGSVDVLNYIGRLYQWGPLQDEREAMRWHQKAADLGSADALYTLGNMEKDPAESIHWYKKALDAGFISAALSIGYRYESGDIRDLSEAVKWFKKAADLGNVSAYVSIGHTYVRHPERRDIAEAVKWFSKAGELGLGDGYYQIGNMYRYGGDGAVPVDYGEAMKWFKKAVEVGDGIGSWAVGTLYRDGNGVVRDEGEAAKWFRKAVEENSGWLHLASELGNMYKKGGPGLARDIEQARAWYRKYGEINAFYKERAEKELAEIK